MTRGYSRRPVTTRDPANPMWWGTIVLRVITLGFAVAAVAVHHDEFQRPWLAWTVLGAMTAWTVVTSVAYARQRWRWRWLVVVDLFATCGLMLTTPWTHTEAMYEANAPLITTVWVSAGVAAVGVRFGAIGGVLGGVVLSAGTMLARWEVTLDVVRDSVLLIATGLVIGLAAGSLRAAAVVLARALRAEAATAERERLARSIHDSVLQVLARVRKRGTEVGGEAAELARLAGEQEIALRALVASEPNGETDEGGFADLRRRLQIRATPKVAVSTPAGEVRLPEHVVDELNAIVTEALSNVERHAGEHARAWLLLEDLGSEVVMSIRDDGPGIAEGRLEVAAAEGRLGVAQSIKARVAALGGTIVLETAPRAGTEWEVHVPRTTTAAAGRAWRRGKR